MRLTVTGVNHHAGGLEMSRRTVWICELVNHHAGGLENSRLF